MFIYNINLSKTLLTKLFLGLVSLCLIAFTIYFTYTIIVQIKNEGDKCTAPASDTIEITNENYTNVLKEVHDNLKNYIGKKIQISGYIYRVSDFNNNQFVLARNMIISSNLQTLVVGFLCEYSKISEFEDGTWVVLDGKIEKGTYHGDIPILKVTSIKKVDKPNNEFVYPPDSSFVPTVNIF